MPTGEIHIKIWKYFLPVTFIVAFFIGILFSWYVAIWVVVGAFVHWFGIDPDLDLPNLHRGEALWIKWVIPIPLIGWSTFYSRIFQKFGGHRSVWTHGFFISSLIRLLYFGFPFIWLFRIYFSDSLLREFIGMFIGLSISDAWHILADMGSGEMNFGVKGKNEILSWILKTKFDYPPNKKSKRN